MSVEANPTATIDLDLTLAQQWVIHHALLEYVEIASTEDADLPQPTVEVTILEKIEASTLRFTACELQRLRYACERHADSTHTPSGITSQRAQWRERSIGFRPSEIPDLFGFGTALFAVSTRSHRNVDDACTRFEKLIEYVNSLGLVAEEVDVTSGAYLGNYPQAFSHVGIINSALYVGYAQGYELPGPPPMGIRLGDPVESER